MNQIIVKKSKLSNYVSTTGLLIPLVGIVENEYSVINTNDYPNNGRIFVTKGFELLDENYFYEIESLKLQDNKNYETDLSDYQQGVSHKNPSKKILFVNAINSPRKLTPIELIPIYGNDFSLTSNKLATADGILSDIFLLKEDKSKTIYGPFQREGLELKAASFNDFSDDFRENNDFLDFVDFYNLQYDNTILSLSEDEISNFLISDNENQEYLNGFSYILGNNIGAKIDITPIPLLHNWAINELAKSAPKSATLLNDLFNVKSNNSTPSNNLKWDKYISLVNQITENEKTIEQLVEILNEKGFIYKEIDSRETDKLTKEIKDLKNELDFKDKVNLTLKDANIRINEELKYERESVSENKIIDSIKFPLLSAALSIEDNISEIESVLKEKITSKKLISENERFSVRKELLDEDIKKRENEIREINKSVEEIKQTYNRSASEHTAKLQEAKIYTDLLNGIEILPNKELINTYGKTNANLISLPTESTSESYILEIQNRLKNQGREISLNDVANLIITINQTFVTIIAGAPGVGKTSLVEKLSKSYGLNENFGYLEIACAKGWTSSKDLIGFFNPLTNKFQPAKTKLREALKKSEENQNSPYIVLLDEANLSPIEHYWSDFIKLADTNYTRKIKISDNEEIQFGDGFRFIATINHDHTTEALSNRLIDRAAIIQLDKPSGTFELNDTEINIDTIFNFKEVENLFVKTKKWQSAEELIKDTFTKIKEKLESNHTIIISPRKEIAIYKYCEVATGLLEGNTYVALDYAISQHILPLINGRGEPFQKMLEGLKIDFNDKGMVKSEKLLHKIIERGKEFKNFKYIYY